MTAAVEIDLDAKVSSSDIPKYRGEEGIKHRIAIPLIKIFKGWRWYVPGLGYIRCSKEEFESRSHPLFKYVGPPAERFVVPILKYVTDRNGKLMGKEVLFEGMVWDFSATKFLALRDVRTRAQDAQDSEDPKILEKVDLMVNCTNAEWQNMTIDPLSKAAWVLKKSEALATIEDLCSNIENVFGRVVSEDKIREHFADKTAEEEEEASSGTVDDSAGVDDLLAELGE